MIARHNIEVSIGPLTMWSVYISAAYLVLSINANTFIESSSFFNYKALATNFGVLALNIDSIVTVISWTMILPALWRQKGWGSSRVIFFQVYNVIIHILPFVCVLINFWLLTDSPAYISDGGLLLIVSLAYLTVNFLYYERFDVIMYEFVDWRNHSNYLSILILFIILNVFALSTNAFNAFIS